MKIFLLILFFSKFILLTPVPISLSEEWVFVAPDKPITAITGGASIRIDISNYINDKMSFEEVKSKFPNGSIKGKLISDNGTIIELENKYSSHNQNQVMLILDANEPIPLKVKFTKVALKSLQPIEKINVYWRNYAQ